MTTTDPESPGRRERLSLLAPEDVERIELDRVLCAPDSCPWFGFVDPPPPYHPGPRRKPPSWAKHLRHLRPLQLVQ